MKQKDIFHCDSDILGGTPVFTGTRVPVDTLTTYLKHSKHLDEFLDDFPSVRREQAEALLEITEEKLLGKKNARTTR